MEKYPKKFLLFILSSLWGKVVVSIVFLGYLAAAIYGSLHLEQGLQLYNLAAKESYFYTFSVWDNDYYTTEPVVMLCFTTEQTYSLNETQNTVRWLLNDIKKDEAVDKNFEINWLDEYKKATFFDDSSEINFIQGLKRFLSINMQFKNDIVFDDTNVKIISSRFYVKSTNIKTSTEQGNFMLRMRDIAKESPVPCIIYTAAFVFFEQYVQILWSTLQTIGIAVAVMLVVTFIFMPDIRVVLIVCVTLVCILVGLFGFMYFWDLTLSSITMIHLVMSVGFSVDFSVHVCHAFISVEGDERKEVLIKALDRSGGPIVNAAFSTLLGILMLAFSSSYIFISFGKVMFLVIAFGLLHAAFFLPLLLYWLSPCLRKHAMAKVSSSSPDMAVEMNGNKIPSITDSAVKTKASENFTDLGTPKY
jgi:predicted RND superfamily exporter protein